MTTDQFCQNIWMPFLFKWLINDKGDHSQLTPLSSVIHTSMMTVVRFVDVWCWLMLSATWMNCQWHLPSVSWGFRAYWSDSWEGLVFFPEAKWLWGKLVEKQMDHQHRYREDVPQVKQSSTRVVGDLKLKWGDIPSRSRWWMFGIFFPGGQWGFSHLKLISKSLDIFGIKQQGRKMVFELKDEPLNFWMTIKARKD